MNEEGEMEREGGRLGIDDIIEVLRQNRWRWHKHVSRRTKMIQ